MPPNVAAAGPALRDANSIAPATRGITPHLRFIAVGSPPEARGEWFDRKAVTALIDAVAHDYDFVIIDSPPLLPAPETAQLAQLAGTMLVVARVARTTFAELSEVATQLAQAEVEAPGVVLNTLEPSAGPLWHTKDSKAEPGPRMCSAISRLMLRRRRRSPRRSDPDFAGIGRCRIPSRHARRPPVRRRDPQSRRDQPLRFARQAAHDARHLVARHAGLRQPLQALGADSSGSRAQP